MIVEMNKLNSKQVLADFMPTIKFWARHYARDYKQVLDSKDLEIVGVIGLLDAMKKFNPLKRNQFKTYAEFRIRGEIIDE